MVITPSTSPLTGSGITSFLSVICTAKSVVSITTVFTPFCLILTVSDSPTFTSNGLCILKSISSTYSLPPSCFPTSRVNFKPPKVGIVTTFSIPPTVQLNVRQGIPFDVPSIQVFPFSSVFFTSSKRVPPARGSALSPSFHISPSNENSHLPFSLTLTCGVTPFSPTTGTVSPFCFRISSL